jgi:hypothetical protein
MAQHMKRGEDMGCRGIAAIEDYVGVAHRREISNTID